MFETHYKALVLQLADALVYLHGKGFTHNDLHEGNVLLRFKNIDGGPVEPQLGICDWGKATQVASGTRLGIEGKGGRKYLPPEHFLPPDWRVSGLTKGAFCAPTTDIFSFGYLLDLIMLKRREPPPKKWRYIARCCQDPEWHKRPTMKAVQAALKDCLYRND